MRSTTGSPDDLHDWARRQAADWPRGMTTLSTHDTKRSEDVRARLLAVAGDPDVVGELLPRGPRAGDGLRSRSADRPSAVADGPRRRLTSTPQRMEDYLLKALREAKQHTAWVDGDADYERRVLDFVEAVRTDGRLHDAIDLALDRNARAVRATVLAAKTLQLTMPGVPDIYQGCEIVDLSLVDPDNRRPVDYERRSDLLARILLGPAAGAESPGVPSPETASTGTASPGTASRGLASLRLAELAPDERLDAEKLLVTSSILRLRRAEPDLFAGGYAPLPTSTEHALGFLREAATSGLAGAVAGALGIGRRSRLVTLVTRAPARLEASGGWGPASVELPEGEWEDVVTGKTVEGGTASVPSILSDLPVAVLVQR